MVVNNPVREHKIARTVFGAVARNDICYRYYLYSYIVSAHVIASKNRRDGEPTRRFYVYRMPIGNDNICIYAIRRLDAE